MRTTLLAALALVAPVSAFGVGEVSSEPEPVVADLGVSASLDSCGVLQTQIVCQLSVSYSTLPNARSYTASVTSPDGAVTDYGEVPAGGTKLTVPYAGNGRYGVRITAYGEPEEPAAEPEVIDTDVAENVGSAPAKPRVTSKETVKAQATTRRAPAAPEDAGDDVQATPEPEPAPDCTEQPPAEPVEPQAPAETADPAAAEQAEAGATDDETSADTESTEPAEVEAQAGPAETAPAEPEPAPAPDDCPTP